MVFGTQSTSIVRRCAVSVCGQASDEEVFDAASVELCEDAVRIKRVVGLEGHAEAASARRALISSRNARTLSGVSSRRPSREIGTSSSVGGRSPARSRALATRPTTSVLTTQVYARLGASHPTIHSQTSTGAFSGSPNGPSPALAHAEAADFSNTTERFGRRSSWVFTDHERRGAPIVHQSGSSPCSRRYARALAACSHCPPLEPQNFQSSLAARL